MTARSEIPSVVCAENVAVLSVLHTVPVPLSTNVIDSSLVEKGNASSYSLSIEQERHLVGALSFLAGVSDNPNDVAAVCIQEIGNTSTTKSLQLLIAVNKATANDNNSVVQELKRGYTGVLSLLAEIGTGHDVSVLGDIKDRVLLAIVKMCKQRILCRLRLVPSQKMCPGGQKQRQPFKDLLSDLIKSLKRQLGLQMSTDEQGKQASYHRVTEQLRGVMGLFTDFAGHQVISEIKALVVGISELRQVPGLQEAILAIPCADVCQSSKDNFINIVTKIARYREIAHLLCHMAARVDLLLIRRWTVVHAELPPGAFHKPAIPETKPDLASIMAAACGRHHSWPSSEFNAILGYLEKDRFPKPDDESLTKTFQRQARNSRVKGRVHAEIQLIAYCELRRKLLAQSEAETMPRVIRSNKATCYLCNLFITECFPKTYFTSRSHGRLYPAWRLPQCFNADVPKRFNAILAQQIKESVSTLQRRKTKTNYLQPAESELTLLPLLQVEEEEEVNAGDDGDTIRPAEQEDAKKEEIIKTVVPVSQITLEEAMEADILAASHTLSDLAAISLTIKAAPEMLADSPMPPCASWADEGRLRRSIEDLLSNSRVKVNDSTTSHFYRVGDLELQVEYDRQDDKRALSFVAEQLSPKEVKRLRMDQLLSTIDVGRLPAGSDTKGLSVDGQGCLYLAVDEGVFCVSLMFDTSAAT
ncbi:hypothetical protein F503_02745 [Ophiostoma piceae UAMH 11346]|uniref:Uncharacterized protein n=1 Tax=Ophiostoma piceae (strain UAMH 11346) TaxID=1262450 RepID=S3C1K4_OPHP1|nr:hypothetical protein F503_02745 [Ophiostoma piceae UAMH 11346]